MKWVKDICPVFEHRSSPYLCTVAGVAVHILRPDQNPLSYTACSFQYYLFCAFETTCQALALVLGIGRWSQQYSCTFGYRGMKGSPGRAECYWWGCVGDINTTGWKGYIAAINYYLLNIYCVLRTPLDVFFTSSLYNNLSKWGLTDLPKPIGFQEAVWDTDWDRSRPSLPFKDPGYFLVSLSKIGGELYPVFPPFIFPCLKNPFFLYIQFLPILFSSSFFASTHAF